jgi:hypothetical protein
MSNLKVQGFQFEGLKCVTFNSCDFVSVYQF